MVRFRNKEKQREEERIHELHSLNERILELQNENKSLYTTISELEQQVHTLINKNKLQHDRSKLEIDSLKKEKNALRLTNQAFATKIMHIQKVLDCKTLQEYIM